MIDLEVAVYDDERPTSDYKIVQIKARLPREAAAVTAEAVADAIRKANLDYPERT